MKRYEIVTSEDMKSYPRVLVISHNVFSATTAMGKTMSNMLSCVPAKNLAQLYFHSEIPTTDVCDHYYRVTDQNVLISVLTRRARGTIFRAEDIRHDVTSPRTDKGAIAKVYQYSRKRTPWIYIMRNTMWGMGVWNTRQLRHWLDEFAPDIIFFASGDYVFSYRVAYTIAEYLKIPLIMWCCDDYYVSKRYSDTLSGRYCYRRLMIWAHRLAQRAQSMIVISDGMKDAYQELFDLPINIMRISARPNDRGLPQNKRSGIVYVGGLGVNRIVPLVEAGRALKAAGIPGYDAIEVYSSDNNEKTLAKLTTENGIQFHGRLPAEKVNSVLGAAKYVFICEAFDEAAKSRTRLSLSTKIGESLQSGACIIAYGPEDITAMQYLAFHQAAVCVNRAEDIPHAITSLNEQPIRYNEIVKCARNLAAANHNESVNSYRMTDILCNKN